MELNKYRVSLRYSSRTRDLIKSAAEDVLENSDVIAAVDKLIAAVENHLDNPEIAAHMQTYTVHRTWVGILHEFTSIIEAN